MPTEEKFGTFIKEKRIACGITLRGLASEIGIAPAYMSDIEKGHRYPPDKDKLYAIATTLHLSEDDRDKMFDLAANAKENTVSPISRSTSWATNRSVLHSGWRAIRMPGMISGRR